MFKLGLNAFSIPTLLSGRGIIAETTPYANNLGTAIPPTGNTAGSLFASLIPLNVGQTVTNIISFVSTVGTNLTFVKFGLFKKDGTFINATAECSTSGAFNTTTGFKVIPLLASYVVPSTDVYYVGILQWGNLATGATFLRGLNVTGSGAAISSGSKGAILVATQTDISANISVATASGTSIYFALS